MLFSKNKNILWCAIFLVYLMISLVLAACTTKNNARSNAAYIIKAKTFNTNCLIHYTYSILWPQTYTKSTYRRQNLFLKSGKQATSLEFYFSINLMMAIYLPKYTAGYVEETNVLFRLSI
jgi:ABC-type uncharacterized transport system auxiliary subunit